VLITSISLDPESKDVYAMSSGEVEITLNGKAVLNNGSAKVLFADIDPQFEDIISSSEDLRVIITPTTNDSAFRGITVSEKLQKAKPNNKMVWEGFEVRELEGGTSSASFDWLVIGRRIGYEDAEIPEEVVPLIETPVNESEPTPETSVENDEEETAPVETPGILPDVSEENPATETPPVEEPAIEPTTSGQPTVEEEPVEETP